MRNPASALLMVAAGVEVVTGFVLLIAPGVFTHLIFGGELSNPGRAFGPLAGFALLALVLACWPVAGRPALPALQAFLFFSACAAVYLVYRGISNSTEVGVLLWPAAAMHALLAVFLAWAVRKAVSAKT